MNYTQNRILMAASFFAATAIAIGAMGAHFLKEKLTPAELISIETAVRYQLYHALALFALVAYASKIRATLLNSLYYVFTAGILCFSFSIYIFIGFALLEIGVPKMLYLITPLGGVLFIIGWGMLFFYGLRNLAKRRNRDS